MFSFIIPCFNGKEALYNTLISFKWQDSSIPFEIILIDNNSSKDNLDDLYNKFNHDLDIYLVKQPRLKTTYALGKARNIGLQLAQYKWVITLDSDIVLNPNYIKSLKEYLRHREGIILTGERIFVERKSIEPLTPSSLQNAPLVKSSSNYNQHIDRRLPYLKKLDTVEHPWAFFHGCNTIFEREAALQMGGFDESYDGFWGYEDIDFSYNMIFQMGLKPIYLPTLFVYHQEEECAGSIERFDKSENPNWEKICTKIDGFKEFKINQYQMLNSELINCGVS